MSRRKFLTGTAAGLTAVAGSSIITSAPAIAQSRTKLTVVSTWPRDFPGLGTSAQRLCARIAELSEGKIEVEYFAAGERVGAFDSFDEVASGMHRLISLLITTGKASILLGLTSQLFLWVSQLLSGLPGSNTWTAKPCGTKLLMALA